MERYEYDHLLSTVPGIGVEALNRYGETLLYFYEDFSSSSGISRAMDQMYNALHKGTLVSIIFHDNHAQLDKEVCK